VIRLVLPAITTSARFFGHAFSSALAESVTLTMVEVCAPEGKESRRDRLANLL
jgi:hypothetical protein